MKEDLLELSRDRAAAVWFSFLFLSFLGRAFEAGVCSSGCLLTSIVAVEKPAVCLAEFCWKRRLLFLLLISSFSTVSLLLHDLPCPPSFLNL